MGSGFHLYARLIRPLLGGALALAPVLATAQTTRTLTIANECPYTVYPGATAGSANAAVATAASIGRRACWTN